MLEKINLGLWEEALSVLISKMHEGDLSEEDSILGATVLEHFGEYDSMFKLLISGMSRFPDNYELYLLTGNYYATFNADQAYLSYENALYLCEKSCGSDSVDYMQIKEILEDYKANNAISVNRVSFVILSYNELEYTRECIESIRNTCYKPCYEIVVVDNGSRDESVEWLRQQEDVVLIENEENKGFPVGCNQGIEAANAANDILLLNNDTILQHNSLYLLRLGLYGDKKFGAAGAVTNYAQGQEIMYKFDSKDRYFEYAMKNNVPGKDVYEFKSKLIMYAMLIKRTTVEKVGSLDERFSPGNFEDDDYGFRILKAGLKNVLCHNCFIYHYGSISFGKNAEKYNQLMIVNRKKFSEKWNVQTGYFTHARRELIKFIEKDKYDKFSVLEVGCGMGETLARIQYEYPNCDVHGIEIVKEVVEIAQNKLDIVEGNIEDFSFEEGIKYDYIIFADVLEHLKYPEDVLIKMKDILKDDGHIITSIPNIMNAKVIYDLMHGSFTYTDAGILDRTHLRFFTKNEIYRMFTRTGYEILTALGIISTLESTDAYKEFYDKLLAIEGMPDKKEFDVYQYLVDVKKGESK